jgi:hypothetical protein
VRHPVGEPVLGDQVAAHGRAAGQVHDRGAQALVALAQLGREPAVPAGQVDDP